MLTKYHKRISGPFLDRIDIHIEVPRVGYEKLSGNELRETSEAIRQRVQAAREIQRIDFPQWILGHHLQRRYADWGRFAMSQLQLSPRAYAQRHVHSTMSSHP